MVDGNYDGGNLFMPPKQEDSFTMNTSLQQDAMAQPQQDLLMGQPQQDLLMGQPQQDLLMGQPQQDLLMGQPQQDLLMGQPQQDALSQDKLEKDLAKFKDLYANRESQRDKAAREIARKNQRLIIIQRNKYRSVGAEEEELKQRIATLKVHLQRYNDSMSQYKEQIDKLQPKQVEQPKQEAKEQAKQVEAVAVEKPSEQVEQEVKEQPKKLSMAEMTEMTEEKAKLEKLLEESQTKYDENKAGLDHAEAQLAMYASLVDKDKENSELITAKAHYERSVKRCKSNVSKYEKAIDQYQQQIDTLQHAISGVPQSEQKAKRQEAKLKADIAKLQALYEEFAGTMQEKKDTVATEQQKIENLLEKKNKPGLTEKKLNSIEKDLENARVHLKIAEDNQKYTQKMMDDYQQQIDKLQPKQVETVAVEKPVEAVAVEKPVEAVAVEKPVEAVAVEKPSEQVEQEVKEQPKKLSMAEMTEMTEEKAKLEKLLEEKQNRYEMIKGGIVQAEFNLGVYTRMADLYGIDQYKEKQKYYEESIIKRKSDATRYEKTIDQYKQKIDTLQHSIDGVQQSIPQQELEKLHADKLQRLDYANKLVAENEKIINDALSVKSETKSGEAYQTKIVNQAKKNLEKAKESVSQYEKELAEYKKAIDALTEQPVAVEKPVEAVVVEKPVEAVVVEKPVEAVVVEQAKQVEEQQKPEDRPFNITDFLKEQGQEAPTVQQLIEEKKKEIAADAKQKKVLAGGGGEVDAEEPVQLDIKIRAQQEEEKFEEGERLRIQAKEAHVSVDEYKQQIKQQEAEEAAQLRQVGKVEFEKGIDSKPNSCERRRRRKSISNAKKRVETDVGFTHHTNKLLDQFDTGCNKINHDNEAGTLAMRPFADMRIAMLNQKRDEKIKENTEKMEKSAINGEKLEIKNPKPVDVGFTETENALVTLHGFVPASITSTILSPSHATRAIGLKALVDKAVSCKIDANMICSLALSSQFAETRELTTSIPAIGKLLDNNPEAKLLMDKQKLAIFETTLSMIPALTMGIEQGLRLNGLNLSGNGYYQDKPNVDVEADKQEAMDKWMQANNNLHVIGSSRQQEVDKYLADSQKTWDKHQAYQLQTQTKTIDRFAVDADVDVDVAPLLAGLNEHKASNERVMEMVRQSLGNQAVKPEFLSMVAGLAPVNATQEQMNEHVARFKKENVEATVKGVVNDFLAKGLPAKLPILESMEDNGKLQELLRLKNKLASISQLPGQYPEVFKDTGYKAKMIEYNKKEAEKSKNLAENRPQSKEEQERNRPKDKNSSLRKLLRSANDVSRGIDHQLEFVVQLHHGRTDQINMQELIKYGEGYRLGQKNYDALAKEHAKVSKTKKADNW